MTVEEFQAAAIAVLRTSVGWQSKIAAKLGVSARTVRRWIATGEIPGGIAAQMVEMVGGVDPSPFPRDEWLIGEASGGDGKTRAYVYHMQAPRFIARIVALDDGGAPEEGERPFDAISGVVYVSDGYCLCEIDWIDRPSPGEIAGLLEAACDAVDESDG